METPVGAELPQVPETDLHYTLNGVSALLNQDAQTVWSGWLPHLDSKVSNALTINSAEHDVFRTLSATADTLTFSTQLDLHHMLRPDVQPGSTIDYEYRPELVTIVLKSSSALTVTSDAAHVEMVSTDDTGSTVQLTIENASETWIPIEISLQRLRRGDPLDLTATWNTADDPRERPFPLRRFVLPWAQPADAVADLEASIARLPPELEGGSWESRTRRVSQRAGGMCQVPPTGRDWRQHRPQSLEPAASGLSLRSAQHRDAELCHQS